MLSNDVCLSVCHTPVLCHNGQTYRDNSFTIYRVGQKNGTVCVEQLNFVKY